MAEASILAYVYVAITGLVLAGILFKLRKRPLNFTFNTNMTSTKKVTLTRSSLLQFNATIIAGLFILLTIQGVVNDNGIFVFIDEITSQKIQDEYSKMMNNSELDPLIREEAKKRFVEIELDSARDLVKITREFETKVVKASFHPITYFSGSLMLMVFSCIFTMYGKDQGLGIKIGEVLTIMGLMVILIGTYIMLVT